MDRLEFDKSIGYASPKEMADKFTENAVMFDIFSWNEVQVDVKIDTETGLYIVKPLEPNTLDDIIATINNNKTTLYGENHRLKIVDVADDSVSISLI